MKMRRYLLVASVLLLIAGCTPKKVVESTYDNGNPKVVKYYKKNNGELKLVKEVVYYDNKTPKLEGAYKDDQREGMWKAWYNNGKLWSEGAYKDGKRNGLGITYHPNGQKYIEGMYKDDIRVGKWMFYDTTGRVIKQVNMDETRSVSGNDTVK